MSKPGRGGHRYRRMRARVLRTEDVCAECGRWVDKTLDWRDPMAPQVDHVVAVHLGGDPYNRTNVRLTHRSCNRAKGTGLSRAVRTPTSRDW